MLPTFVVVDDFYKDADRVRRIALEKGDFVDSAPGKGGHIITETISAYYTDAVVAEFERLIGSPIKVEPRRKSFGVFYYLPENRDQPTHFDDTEWSALIYLVPPQLCSGGLGLYRHIATGYEGPPEEPAARTRFLTQYYEDKFVPDRWELVGEIPIRYNRLILFQGARFFHRPTKTFGESPASGRLVQRFFFDLALDDQVSE